MVERLRTEEENYYKELYSQTVSESDEPDEASKLLQLTSETVYKLKLMPAYVLGATLNDRKDRQCLIYWQQVKV